MRIVQARIDDKTEKLLARLRRMTGMTDSEIVRKGIALVGELAGPSPALRVRGVGEFHSGHTDLASNKKHLAGLGRK